MRAANSELERFRASLQKVVAFLAKSFEPTRHLEFALAAHTDQVALKSLAVDVESAFEAIQRWGKEMQALGLEVPQAVEESVRASMFEKWRLGVDAFASRICEVWEVHTYFVFLDVKGDRALFEQTARHLCRLLGCSVYTLVNSFAYTRPWAESALHAFAHRQLLPMLKRQHSEALRRWREVWAERASQAPESHRISDEVQHGVKFWDSYFTHLSKISWPDFVEAFEHFYFLGRCPLDLVAQLRTRIDPAGRHHVSRATWQTFLRERSSIWGLIDLLLGEVLSDVEPRIYRAESLRAPAPSKQCEAQSNEAAGSGSAPTEDGEVASAMKRLSINNSSNSAPASGQGQTKKKPWFPFTHGISGDDDDMAIATPVDQRLQQHESSRSAAAGSQPTMAWNDFVAGLCARHRPWWGSTGEVGAGPSAEAEGASAAAFANEEPYRVAALRAVQSSIACTHKALIFRVVSGDLAQNRPLLDLKGNGSSNGESAEETGGETPNLLPALVVTANGTRFSGVTKFGRSSQRRTLLPDCPMTEFIASRSHFNVVYEQDSDKYYLMDSGSKWGTFVKIGSSATLSCGDWIRVGGVEFIVRYCGGGCACQNRHAHYRLHSLRLLREHQAFASAPGARGAHRYEGPDDRLSGMDEPDGELDYAGEDPTSQLQDKLLLMLSSRRARGWTSASARLCQRGAQLRGAGSTPAPPDSSGREEGAAQAPAARTPISSAPARSSPSSAQRRTAGKASGLQPRGGAGSGDDRQQDRMVQVPVAPLELDFISGPRMGEKLVLTERVCTMGRGEGNTIQVSDSQLASVSRVHCIFEYTGNRWHLQDNGSTNGTWRRLSCVLEPSQLVPVQDGMSIQAGVHEFLVEEAEMRNWWTPSSAIASFEELCEQERRELRELREHQAQKSSTKDNASSIDGL